MKKQFTYKGWSELTEAQRETVISKLAKLSKTDGVSYLKQPGMKYTIDDEGNATGGYQDPYILSKVF